MTDRCAKQVFDNWSHRQCSRKAVKDGWCKQHHPDAAEERKQKSIERYEEKRKNEPLYRLARANEKIKQLEEENRKLREWIDSVCDVMDHE